MSNGKRPEGDTKQKTQSETSGHSGGHSHFHFHDHDHDHSHPPSPQKTSALKLAFFLNGGFALVEILGGIWTGSIAVLADAVHDAGDTLGLGLALILEKVSSRSRDEKFTYGYARFSVLSALLTAGVIIGGSVFIFTEAIDRLYEPHAPKGLGMIGLAVLGVAVNGFATYRLSRNQSHAPAHEKIFTLHLLEDTVGWVLVLLGAIVIHFTGIYWIDPILALLLACYVIFNATRHAGGALKVFLQAVPEAFRAEEFDQAIKKIPGVESYHDLHVWSLDGRHHVVSLHVHLKKGFDNKVVEIKKAIVEILEKWGDFHVTLETETNSEECRGGCDDETHTKLHSPR